MKFVIDKNCTGKTRMLIKQSLDNNVPIFALSASKAESLREKSMVYFGKLVHVVTAQDFTDGYSGPIMIDDMDKAFYILLAAHLNTTNFNLVGATLTED